MVQRVGVVVVVVEVEVDLLLLVVHLDEACAVAVGQ
jgi:hypothetical protein